MPTGVTLAGAMAYNSAKVPNPPSTWQSLLSSQWKGQVGTNDPSQSGPTYPFIAGMMNHLGSVAKGENFFAQLKTNGLIINPTNGPTLAALSSGQINIALVQSSAAVGATFTDKSIKVKYLDPVTILPSAIGIDAKASKQEQMEAEEFVAYVLSPAGQHVMQTGDPTGDSLYYPVLNGVSPLPALPSLGVGPRTVDQPLHLGPTREHDQRLVRQEHRAVITPPRPARTVGIGGRTGGRGSCALTGVPNLVSTKRPGQPRGGRQGATSTS